MSSIGKPDDAELTVFGLSQDIVFVVYTERKRFEDGATPLEVIRLISARMATSFERGLYYGKQE